MHDKPVDASFRAAIAPPASPQAGSLRPTPRLLRSNSRNSFRTGVMPDRPNRDETRAHRHSGNKSHAALGTEKGRPLRVALAHDWLTGMRGGEYVLEAIAEMFPQATLFTLVNLPGAVSETISRLPCRSSILDRVPRVEKYYRHFLPLMPRLIESFDLSEFDLIVSSSHCVAKGIRKAPGSVHVSYVHAPMRYIWNRYADYFGPGRASLSVRCAAAALRGTLQRWDRTSSSAVRVDRLVANSQFTADQVEQAYGRRASVVHPFVDLSRFQRPRQAEGAYLMVGAFAPNKRVDIAIEAFNRLKLPLWIVGRGQQEAELRAMAGSTVTFLGALPNAEIEVLYAKARAFVFPGVEDFGITPLEAMASGTPVIAYAEGGALETIVDGVSGLHFASQTADSLCEAITRVESQSVRFDEDIIRAHARQFTRRRFQERLFDEIQQAWAAAGKGPDSLTRPALFG